MNNLMLMSCDALLTEALRLQKENAELCEKLTRLETVLQEQQEILKEEMLQNTALEKSYKDLLDICIEFCRKVECGEAKSVRTYQQMKTAIERIQGENHD